MAKDNRWPAPHTGFPVYHRAAEIAILVGFAILYLSTLDNGLRPGELEGGDLITHQYAQVQGRPGNAPGYPLYTMGGWLWFRLGRLILGQAHNPIPILASYSTLWALWALWLLYRLILEVTDRGEGGNWILASLVTAFYGVTYFFWYYAVTTEQYTSAVAWTLAVVLLAVRWERLPWDGYLLGLACLVGVGLAHMVTVLFVVPPLLWFVLSREPRLLRRPRTVVQLLGAAVLPLLSYAYVYGGGALHQEWRGAGQWASTWEWFWSFISTAQGRSELTWSLRPFLTPEFPSLIWEELTWPGLILGLGGLAVLGYRRAGMLYGTMAIYVAFCWIDRLGNWFQVIMPAYALLAVGMAAAADWAWQQGRDATAARNGHAFALFRGRGLLRPLVAAGLVALIAYRGALSYPRADASDRPGDTALEPGLAILADAPAPGTAVFGTLADALALNYVTGIWGLRPDLESVTATEARARLASGSGSLAVTTSALPLVPAEIGPQAHYSALGPTLVALRATPNREMPAGLLPWQQDFGSDLRLAGGRFTLDQATGHAAVLLVWQALEEPERDWSISVRLTQSGSEIAQVDRQHPVTGAYPTDRWSRGEIVADAYPFDIPPGSAPDGVVVIVYRSVGDGGFENLGRAGLSLR